MNNNSKEEEDEGTYIHGYCDHNIEKEKKFFFFRSKRGKYKRVRERTNK